MGLIQPFAKVRELVRLIPYWGPMVPIWVFFRLACEGRIEGEAVIKELKGQGFIIAANHVSYLDWLILYIYFLFKHGIKMTFFANKDRGLDHPL